MSRQSRDSAVETNRNFPRVSSSCPIRYRPLADVAGITEAPGDSSAVMNNISGGGISFNSPDRFDPGQMLALEVDLPGFPTSVISMGKVVWCTPSGDEPGRFDVGVEFWWVGWRDAQAQQKVSNFITDALGDPRD
ncbi:MAG: PilZ domain-containing protein [Planctomycetes bacterium]|nr:PilZ domain-containing protein [Planctomycetota bacterium]